MADRLLSLAVAGSLRDDPVRYRAAVSPDAIATHDLATGERLSYAALDRRIAATSNWLSAAVAEEGGRVAMLGRNSVAQIALALACQRAGLIFVPLNWRLAEAELAEIIADCCPALLAHDPEFAEAAAATGGTAQRLALTELPDWPMEIAAAPPGAAPFALLYTSGTTGRPKGVIVTRANAFCAALNFALVGEIGPDSVVLADLPLFHTIGLIAVTRTTLLMGGTLVVSDRFDATRTLAALGDETLGITHYFGVPAMAAPLRAEPGFSSANFARLRAMFLGGAPMPQPLIEAWLDDGVRLVNGYGMSEAGTIAHMPIDADAIRRHPGAIGLPAPIIDIRIVDAAGADVVPGAVGELWVRGPSVTPGYWQQPEMTAAAFVDGWFRTGDLASRGPQGMLRLVERLKDMYISGGENVYPAEIESALLAYPDVADAAVVGVPDARWGEAGVAFVVARPSATLDEGALRAHCAARLARYKCPIHFTFVTVIPRTASGKVQKHLLRASLEQELS